MSAFPELLQLDGIIKSAGSFATVEQLASIKAGKSGIDYELPIWGLTFGSRAPSAPTFVLTAGVHGLERVGTHVVNHFLTPLIEQLKWDRHYQDLFSQIRLAVIPIVNPGGMFQSSRCNPQNVDIMRNAETTGSEKGLPLVSGQTFSPRLPWYKGTEIQIETKALIDFVKAKAFQSEFAMALDIHSGFGMIDRLWYPWSCSKEKIPDIPLVREFEALLLASHPFHFYKIETQTDAYVVHGDPWDFLYSEHLKSRSNQIFLPWTLEMGSWTWLRKNPGQLFSRDGMYNPIIPHRYNRTMRRHRPLLEFFLRALASYRSWHLPNETITSPSLNSNLQVRPIR